VTSWQDLGKQGTWTLCAHASLETGFTGRACCARCLLMGQRDFSSALAHILFSFCTALFLPHSFGYALPADATTGRYPADVPFLPCRRKISACLPSRPPSFHTHGGGLRGRERRGERENRSCQHAVAQYVVRPHRHHSLPRYRVSHSQLAEPRLFNIDSSNNG